jgi:hypothetical protein
VTAWLGLQDVQAEVVAMQKAAALQVKIDYYRELETRQDV